MDPDAIRNRIHALEMERDRLLTPYRERIHAIEQEADDATNGVDMEIAALLDQLQDIEEEERWEYRTQEEEDRS